MVSAMTDARRARRGKNHRRARGEAGHKRSLFLSLWRPRVGYRMRPAANLKNLFSCEESARLAGPRHAEGPHLFPSLCTPRQGVGTVRLKYIHN